MDYQKLIIYTMGFTILMYTMMCYKEIRLKEMDSQIKVEIAQNQEPTKSRSFW